MVGLQTDFLAELAEHRLLRTFPGLDTALWKLPGVFAHALAPEHEVAPVGEYDSYIGTIAITIDHHRSPQALILRIFSQVARVKQRLLHRFRSTAAVRYGD
jgi:hypothetical protein